MSETGDSMPYWYDVALLPTGIVSRQVRKSDPPDQALGKFRIGPGARIRAVDMVAAQHVYVASLVARYGIKRESESFAAIFADRAVGAAGGLKTPVRGKGAFATRGAVLEGKDGSGG